ncbi:CoA transferase [Thermocatellispora tengchongensis]|uniref:CoA transferase n=1 Tax=Thermocatellispora tengchongensis TaxID=1073253 RepID=UPI0035E42AC6
MAELNPRRVTGRGQVVRTSLLAAIVGVHAFQGTACTVVGQVGHAQGDHHPSITPYGQFRCEGGAVQLSCGSESPWRRLCAEFGLDAEARMATNADRVANRRQVIELVEAACAGHPAEELPARPVGYARSTRSAPGSRPCHRACSWTSSTPPSAGCASPAPRCASSLPARPARPRPPTATTPRRRCSTPTGPAIRAELAGGTSAAPPPAEPGTEAAPPPR